jgi:hypothetical protein
MYRKPAVLLRVPIFVFSPRSGGDGIACVLVESITHKNDSDSESNKRTFGSVWISNQPLHRWHLQRNEYVGVL